MDSSLPPPSDFPEPLSSSGSGLTQADGTAWVPAGETEAETDLRAELARWQDLLSQVGRELAEPLTAALERVPPRTPTGRIARHGLRALRQDVDRARQAGIWCQQIARLASGRIRQSHERVHLTHTVQSVLAYRAREMHNRGLNLSQSLQPVEVQIDASMLFGLLNALVDWWLDCAHEHIDLRIDIRHWPVRAQLTCRVRLQAADQPQLKPEQVLARVNTMHWHLLDQTARTLGVHVERQTDGAQLTVQLQFPGTIQQTLPDADVPQAAHGPHGSAGFTDSINSKPLAGSHVLVIAARRDLRLLVREALRDMGLVLDFVSSMREAAQFCQEGLPHAIVFEGDLRASALDHLVSGIRREVPDFVFVELSDDAPGFDISTTSTTGMARVGIEGLGNALPSALVYELSRVM
jgi:CheY-like chemotaxis protein